MQGGAEDKCWEEDERDERPQDVPRERTRRGRSYRARRRRRRNGLFVFNDTNERLFEDRSKREHDMQAQERKRTESERAEARRQEERTKEEEAAREREEGRKRSARQCPWPWAEGSRKQGSLQDPDTKGHLLITAGPITKLCAGSCVTIGYVAPTLPNSAMWERMELGYT
jgi:hypothetical protein